MAKNENRIAGVYKITNTINNKIYIGESLNIEERWNEHKQDLEDGTHHSYKLQQDYNTYGIDKFKFEVERQIMNTNNSYKDKINLILEENKLIKKYNSLINGYNIEDTLYEILFNNKIIFYQHDKTNIINKLIFEEEFFTEHVLKDITNYIKSRNDKKYYKFGEVFRNIPYIKYEEVVRLRHNFQNIDGIEVLSNGRINMVNKDGIKYIIKYILDDLDNHHEVFRMHSISKRYKYINKIS